MPAHRSLRAFSEEIIMTAKRIAIFGITLAIGIACYARIEIWPIPTKPTISLARAEAIGDKTVAQEFKGSFCIRASFAMLGETNQEWTLTYANSKGETKLVIIDGKESARLHEGPRDL